MKSEEEKNRRKQLLAEVKKNEKEAFLKTLPMVPQQFKKLFDFLDEQIEQNGCNHTLSITKAFLADKNIQPEPVITWLKENGGYCDCEVIYNVEELFENI